MLFTIAGTGLQVLLGFAERVALPIETPAVIYTCCVVSSIYGRWTLTAVALHVEGKIWNHNHKQLCEGTVQFSSIYYIPVQEDTPLQVALMASWHLVSAFSNMQSLQHGLFLSLWREQRHTN